MKTSLAVSPVVLSLSVLGITSAAESEAAPEVPAAPASPHTFTGNGAAVSNYVFRGIAHTSGGLVIQGGFDYSHAGWFYACNWDPNVSWVTDNIAAASDSMDSD